MKHLMKIFGVFLTLIVLTTNCDKDGGIIDADRGLILMPISQESGLGEQLDSTIMANPDEYPILDRTKYSQVYEYMEVIFNDILNNTGEPLKYKTKFEWKLTIINKDELNAFAAPGGKLYFYTGLLKYLDNASKVAGVLGHEMAHADLRHSASQMQKTYGINFAASILLGSDKSQLEQIITDIGSGLAGLQFSRSDEYQADEFSVKYLAGTSPINSEYDAKYDPRGVAGFFEQLTADGMENQSWEILSTHPSGSNRVAEVDVVWTALGSPSGEKFEKEYQAFIALLP